MAVASSNVNEAWNCRRYVARGMADGIDEVELISKRLCFYHSGRALGLLHPVSSWRAPRAHTVLYFHNDSVRAAYRSKRGAIDPGVRVDPDWNVTCSSGPRRSACRASWECGWCEVPQLWCCSLSC